MVQGKVQTNVNVSKALGVFGFSRNNPKQTLPRVAEGATLRASSFAFAGTNPSSQVQGTKAGATEVAGFVIYNGLQLNASGGQNSTLIYEGQPVELVLQGFVYAILTNVSNYADKVAVNPTTGEMQAYSTNVPTDFIDTGWKVETPALANETCEIYKI